MDELIFGRETLAWAAGLSLGFPLAMLALNEAILRLKRHNRAVAGALRIARNLVLPSLAVLLLLQYVLDLAADGVVVKIAQTVFWLTAIHGALCLVNDVVFSDAKEGSWQARVPKLMIDVIRLMLVLVGGAIVLGVVWRYDLTKLLTALGVGSIVIGLALQEPLGNVISGLMLMLERPIKIGDWINTEGVVGKITEINWRSVHVETPLRELRIIPNSCLYKGTFSNLARPTPVRTEMLDLGFSYDDPPNKVKDVLMGLLRTTPGILADPAPVIRTVNYADFSIIYKVIFSVGRQEDLYEARDAFMTRVWYAARRHGLTIPFPIQTEIQVGPDDLKQRRGPTRAQVLQNLPRFAIRDDSLVRDLVERVEVRTFARGERIAEEGKPLEGLHLVLSGRAILSVRDREGTEHEIAHVGRGEFFGEGSLLTGQSSDLTITVLEDLEVLVFDSSAVHRWLDRTPRLARELGSLLDVRRRAAGVARKLAGARG